MGATQVIGLADVARILELAEKVPVFPCNRDKTPLTRNGFYDATQDVSQIARWWKAHPDALVGVPTGRKSGLVVIDYDHEKAGDAAAEWVRDNTATLLGTISHHTRRAGGKHYLFRAPLDAEYGSGKDVYLAGKQRRGIDVRAEGGYVIWWPLHGAETSGEAVAPLPPGLMPERQRHVPTDRTIPAASRQLIVTAKNWALERKRVIDALAHVDPADRDVWVKIGQAIHLASAGNDDGFAVWHAWSAGGLTGDVPSSYVSENDCRYAWASFNKRTEGRELVTLGTLFALAKAAGYNRDTTPVMPDDDRFAPFDPDAYENLPPDLEGEEWSEPATPKAQALALFRPLAEIMAEKREAEWLLRDVLEARVLAILAGPRGTFKSFIALDWAMRIAVQGHGVLILSGEGAGLDRRADAWHRTYAQNVDMASLRIAALERPVNLNLDETYALVDQGIAALGWKPSLILVDTFSKFSAGIDENDNGEISTFLSRLSDRLRHSHSCAVLMVAHSGHADANRPRGASALMANPDAEYIVTREPLSMSVSVSRDRFKDTASLPALNYTAKVVDLGRVDRYSEPVTSLVLEALEGTETVHAPRAGTGKHQGKALAALKVWMASKPASNHLPNDELKDLMKAADLPRQRRHDVIHYLTLVGALTPSVGGFTVNREAF